MAGVTRSAKSFQAKPVLIDDNTYTMTAATQKRTIKVAEKLSAKSDREQVPHAIALFYTQDLDPTFTTAPTQVGNAAAVNRILFKAEDARVMFDLSGPDIRALEAYEGGGQAADADPDLDSASTNNFYSSRWLSFGPEGYQGNPSDFAIALAALENSSIEETVGPLTDVSADTTAATVRTRKYFAVVGLPEVRIAPKVEKKSWDGAGNKLEVAQRAKVCSLLMLDSSAHGAIGGTDFTSLTLDDPKGNWFNGIDTEVLTAMYRMQMSHGQIGMIQGEPQAATDDNAKVKNGATPTALTAAVAALQPVVWSPNGMRLTKVQVHAPFILKWTGGQATSYILAVMVLPRAEGEARGLAERVFRVAGLPFKGGKAKTLSKKPYVGPDVEFMPMQYNYRGE
jgi:hypothetical protein